MYESIWSTWRDSVALLSGSVGGIDQVLLDQGGDVIGVEDCQVVEPEGQTSDGFEVSLHGLVEKIHDLISWPAMRYKFNILLGSNTVVTKGLFQQSNKLTSA